MKGYLLLAGYVLSLTSSVSLAASDVTEQDQYRVSALKIIGQYGTRSTLSSEQLRNYLNDEAFKRIDLDKDGVLQFPEFREARLYCLGNEETESWACDSDYRAVEAAFDAVADNADITASRLLATSVSTWGRIVRQQAQAWWERLPTHHGDVMDATALAELLASNAEIRGLTPARKIEQLAMQYADVSPTVSLDDLEIDILIIGLESADKNLSGTVDVLEFVKAFDGPQAIQDFNALLGQTQEQSLILDVRELGREGVESGVASDTFTHLMWRQSDLIRITFDGAGADDQHVDNLHVAADEISALEAAANRKKMVPLGPFGTAYVKNRGLVFPSTAVKFNPKSKSAELSNTESLLTLRLIEDFTKAGSKANAGTISWSKDAGTSPSPNFGLAIRADWQVSSWDHLDTAGWQVRPAFGVQYNRIGRGDDKTDVRKVFAILDTNFGDGTGFLRAHHLQIGPVFEKDQVAKVDKVTGLVEWEPILAFPKLTTGVYYPVTSSVAWYIRPRFAIELNDIRERPESSNAIDRSFYRYGAEIGFSFGDRTTLTYDYRQRHATTEWDEDYHFQTAQFAWQLDELGIYKLTIGFSQGRDSPGFQRVENYKLGLGVKY